MSKKAVGSGDNETSLIDKSKNAICDWLNDTTPPIKGNIPSAGELVSNTLSTFTTSIMSNASEIEKYQAWIVNEKNIIQPNAAGTRSLQTIKPYEKVGSIGKGLTGLALGLDIGNTFSENDGNTNLKRVAKGSIQTSGIAMAGLTTLIASRTLSSRPEFTTEFGGLTKGAMGIMVGVDIGIGVVTEKVQDWVYDKLGIKHK